MPTRATFDTHFPGQFLAWPDEAAKVAILDCIERGALELWVSLEVLEELMGVVKTRDTSRLVPLADTVLRLTSGRILNLGEFLVASELEGNPSLELEPEARAKVLAFLQQLAGGHIPSATPSIAERALNAKRETADQLRSKRAQFQTTFPNLGKGDLTKIPFGDVHERHWQKQGSRFVQGCCVEYGVADPEGTAAKVMDDPGQYPRTRNRMKALSLLLHRYLVSGEKIDDGDVYDIRQMIYLNDMDAFVTDEKRLRERCKEVFDGKEVLSVRGFMERKWC